MKIMLRNGQKSHINIPKELWRDKLGWKISQDVNIKVENNRIIIEEIEKEGFEVLSFEDFMAKDYSKEGFFAERGYRRGYRHGYSQGIGDMHVTGAYNKLCKFFDKYIMPWTTFKGKYKKKGFCPPPEYKWKKHYE